MRTPAKDLYPDSDLGERLVTVDVPALSGREVETALAAGLDRAEEFLARGLIDAAALSLQGAVRLTGSLRTLADNSS